MPESTVAESRQEERNVRATPSTITPVSSTEESSVRSAPALAPTKNIAMIAMMVGKRPLQGTKLFVSIAMRRSRGLSMMRQPITPAALQPKPMHMVSACLPQARQRLKL